MTASPGGQGNHGRTSSSMVEDVCYSRGMTSGGVAGSEDEGPSADAKQIGVLTAVAAQCRAKGKLRDISHHSTSCSPGRGGGGEGSQRLLEGKVSISTRG